jgi:hypothetical protein
MENLRNTTRTGKGHQIVLLSVVVFTIVGTAILDFLTPVGIVGGMLYGGPIYLTGLLSFAEDTKRRLVVAVAVLCTVLTVLVEFSHGMCPSCLDHYLHDLDQKPPGMEITPTS